MNPYLIIVLAALIGEHLLQTFARALTLRAHQEEVPVEFADVYDAAEYARAQRYARARTQLAFLSSGFHLLTLVLFILLGGFDLVDGWARGFGFASMGTGLIFFAALWVLDDLLSTPFSLWETLVIETKFGFNKATLGTLIADKAKTYALVAVLGGLLLGAILYLFENLGARAWLYAWVVVAAGTVVLPVLFTSVIAPLFNRFEPLDEGELKGKLSAFAKQVGFPLGGIYVMDGSKRSTKANAYFSGLGRSKRIVLFDTLIAGHNPTELVAILGHEIGHYKLGHIIQGTLVSILYTGVLLFTLGFFIDNPGLFAAFGMEQISTHGGLLFFLLLFSPISILLGIVVHWLSRRNEYQADRFAAEHLGEAEPMIAGLKKLSVANLSNLTPHPFDVFLNHTHPTALQRVSRLRLLG